MSLIDDGPFSSFKVPLVGLIYDGPFSSFVSLVGLIYDGPFSFLWPLAKDRRALHN